MKISYSSCPWALGLGEFLIGEYACSLADEFKVGDAERIASEPIHGIGYCMALTATLHSLGGLRQITKPLPYRSYEQRCTPQR